MSESRARSAIDYLMALSPRPQIIVGNEVWKSNLNIYLDQLRIRTGQTWQGVIQAHCPPGAWNGSYCNGSEEEGVMILTSFSIVNSELRHLGTADCWHSARAGARAGINVDGIVVQVFATHLQTGSCTDAAQARANSMNTLKSWASNYSGPYLAAGDFNADPDQIDAGMWPNFVNAWNGVGSGYGATYPASSPSMHFDYWFRDQAGKASPYMMQVPTSTSTFSDHRPVLGGFSFRP
jgi:endonuclease/exonuclease/phosphatase family metal-dependent hydrolase